MLLGRAVDVGPCASAGAEWIVAEGFGASQPSNAIATFFAPALGVRGVFALADSIALRAGAEAGTPLPRPTFVIDNAGTVERAGAVTVRATAGAEVHF
jgi:hypothetical protein